MEQAGKRFIHYTELPDAKPEDSDFDEWNTFRRELPRLLAEGHEGKFALLKGTEVIGIYDTWEAGYDAGLERYLLQGQGFLVQPIRTWEPLLRLRGYSF
jgi:hypothetical protein